MLAFISYYKKKATIATTNEMKTKVSIKANAIKVVLNKLSASSGFLAALKVYPANKTPVPIAAPARVIIHVPITKILTAVITSNLVIISDDKKTKNVKLHSF